MSNFLKNLPVQFRCPKTGENISGLTEKEINDIFKETIQRQYHPRNAIAHNSAMGAKFIWNHDNGITRALIRSGTPEGAKAFIEGAKVYVKDFLRVIDGGTPIPRADWIDKYEHLPSVESVRAAQAA